MSMSEYIRRLLKMPMAKVVLTLLASFALLGIYAPCFASSKPFVVLYEKQIYFPFFRYLFDQNIYTQKLDLFYNLLMLILPVALAVLFFIRGKRQVIVLVTIVCQMSLFGCLTLKGSSWISSMHSKDYWAVEQSLKENSKSAVVILKPMGHHWQENLLASSEPGLQRINGQSLWAALLFGIRYSLTIAILATLLAFIIGVFVGATAGFFGRNFDLVLGRGIEIWESIPPLFVILLLVFSYFQSSFLGIVLALALFSWTSIARVVRMEVIKQKSMPYTYVLRGLGYKNSDILIRHILTFSLPTLISLAPFALVGAITYEAALSFLGLGSRQNCSIGLLIDEARMLYPMEPALFWPPAIALMILLISLTYLGDLSKRVLNAKESFR